MSKCCSLWAAVSAYQLTVKPGGESIIAAGAWQPGKNELATIRSAFYTFAALHGQG